EFGECIINKLKNDRVDISQIRVLKDTNTGIAFNQYCSDGSRKFIFAAGAAGKTSPNDIKGSYFSKIKNLHIMGSALSISKTSREACYKAIKIAKQKNPSVIISFDPNIRPEMLDLKIVNKICEPVLKETNILLPSGEEAVMLAGVKDEKEASIKLLEKGPELVVLKQGKEGCTLFSSENLDGVKISCFKVNQVDPTGAGDSFGGAFMVGYLLGWELEKTAKFANAVGALKVQTFGPMPDTTYNEVLELMKTNEV
ncbi:MAG: carbohydrate kinase family protein, partial [Candidatus Hodarchaeota archaeon]